MASFSIGFRSSGSSVIQDSGRLQITIGGTPSGTTANGRNINERAASTKAPKSNVADGFLLQLSGTVRSGNSSTATNISGGNGNTGNNWLNSNEGNNSITGYAGNDTLYGKAGNDTLYGKAGNDTLYSNAGNDLLSGNQGDDLLDGGGGNDTMYGGKDNDRLVGNDGNDYLSGDFGRDTLRGGRGSDRFVFNNKDTDVVEDFHVSDLDVFAIASGYYAGAPAANTPALVSDAAGAANSNLANNIIVDSSTAIRNLGTGAINTRFAYATDTNQLLYDTDGNWSTGSLVVAQVTLFGTLSAANFEFVS